MYRHTKHNSELSNREVWLLLAAECQNNRELKLFYPQDIAGSLCLVLLCYGIETVI